MGPRLAKIGDKIERPRKGKYYDRRLTNLAVLVCGCHLRPPIAILASDGAAHYIYGNPNPHMA
jgi:hypothetical protein